MAQGQDPDTASDSTPEPVAPAKKPARKRTTKKVAAPEPDLTPEAGAEVPVKRPAAKKTAAKKTAAKKSAATKSSSTRSGASKASASTAAPTKAAAQQSAPATSAADDHAAPVEAQVATEAPIESTTSPGSEPLAPAPPSAVPLFQVPDASAAPVKKTRKRSATTVVGAHVAQAAEPETAAEPARPDATLDSPEQVPPEDDEAAATSEAQEIEGSGDDASEGDGSEGDGSEGDGSEGDGSEGDGSEDDGSEDDGSEDDGEGSGGGGRRRRRRGGRRRRKSGGGGQDAPAQDASGRDSSGPDGAGGASAVEDRSGDPAGGDDAERSKEGSGGSASEGDAGSGSTRRRRRRRREGDESGSVDGEPRNTVTRVRKARSAEDEITAVAGSTRLEAKKQRRREGREAGRRRAPIVSEAEFLARRESVDRTMVIRQRADLTQIAVLEDSVLVEHYVARESQTSLIGNVYVGRVQNVLPSMEAAFIDIGKGRNAVLYAGEVNWQALGHKDGAPRKIESVLSSGQSVLVQVTKDPVGHKGARLTSQVSLAGRFLVYVPDGTTNGISRKLPDTERSRLKSVLKAVVPASAGVIVRTAAEGASEDELTRDVERLKARWEDIEAKTAKAAKGGGAQLLYGEPDLTLKVVRDLFTEDFGRLVIQGSEAWETVQGYVAHVAPDLEERLEHDQSDVDVFATYRVDEQIAKGLDRKVWLPSGGSLIIDRTEAMTVVDVNTGKFTGSGGNLEETVTKNNLEAAEEMVRQLRLRDIGGIIVIDFIDMVLESNRDLVLRRLVECLGRDRTRHQVAEVTSLGLVQMTRKRIGTGLLEAFSHSCGHCSARGVLVQADPVEPRRGDDEPRKGGRRGRGSKREQDDSGHERSTGSGSDQRATDPSLVGRAPSPADVAAMARAERPVEESAATGREPTQADPAAAAVEVPPAEPAADAPAPPPPATVELAPAEMAPVDPAPVDPAPEAPAEPAAAQADAEAGTADPRPATEPGETRVVTRTRRRSASRPGGEPRGTQPAPIVVSAAAADEPGPESTGEPVAAPKVVTRTRGRSARRSAGPPAVAADSPSQ